METKNYILDINNIEYVDKIDKRIHLKSGNHIDFEHSELEDYRAILEEVRKHVKENGKHNT